MSLNKKEIQEKYLWLTKGNDECIILEKNDYETFMSKDIELFVLEKTTCDIQSIVDTNRDILQNARTVIISFITSREYSLLNLLQFVEDLTKYVDESCEVIFTSHPDEAMSDDACSLTLLIK